MKTPCILGIPSSFCALLPGHSEKVIKIHWGGRDGKVWRAAQEDIFNIIHNYAYDEPEEAMLSLIDLADRRRRINKEEE